MLCSQCEKQIPETAKVCGYCGSRVTVGELPESDRVGKIELQEHERSVSAASVSATTEDAERAQAPRETEAMPSSHPESVTAGPDPAPIASQPTKPVAVEAEAVPGASVPVASLEPSLVAIQPAAPIQAAPPVGRDVDPNDREPVPSETRAFGWRTWIGLVGAVLVFLSPWFNWVGGRDFNKSRIVDEFECCEPAIGADFVLAGTDLSVVGLLDAGQLIAVLGLLGLVAFAIPRVRFLGVPTAVAGIGVLVLWYVRVFLREPYSFTFTFSDHVGVGPFIALAGLALLLLMPLRARRTN